MIVWKVPQERSEEVGLTMAAHNAVTHCYERSTFPDWPYTHFTMVHATTPEGCEEINNEISDRQFRDEHAERSRLLHEERRRRVVPAA